MCQHTSVSANSRTCASGGMACVGVHRRAPAHVGVPRRVHMYEVVEMNAYTNVCRHYMLHVGVVRCMLSVRVCRGVNDGS